MKLNPDCVRQVLLCIEKHQIFNQDGKLKELPASFLAKLDDMVEFSKEEILYTIDKLAEGDYIKTTIKWNLRTDHVVMVQTITYNGHQFLEAIREPKIWKQTKSTAGKIGIFSLNCLLSIAQGIATESIKKLLGQP